MKTLDTSTLAAVPGELALSRKRYARYFGRNVTGRWYCLLCTYLPWSARRLPFFGAGVWHWARTQEHLQYGCLNPAVVLDAARGIVAVFSDLRNGMGAKPVPVVKIVRERLDLISSPRVAEGSRFAAAAVYSQAADTDTEERWDNFFPIVVDCLVDDRAACEGAAARLQPDAWNALELAVKQLDDRGTEGLFYVDIPEEIVENAYST